MNNVLINFHQSSCDSILISHYREINVICMATVDYDTLKIL